MNGQTGSDSTDSHGENPRVALTVVLPVLNEASNLPAALESVSWVDQVIVVDSNSSDGTVDTAVRSGAEVVQFRYLGHGPKKKSWALENVTFKHEWVLFLDADERVTPALRDEIRSAIADTSFDGYCIDREFIFMGRSLLCFRPNWNLRLFKHRLGRVEDLGLNDLKDTGDNEIHEHIRLEGRLGFLHHPLLHDDYRGLTPWLERHNKYATWEAHLYAKFRSEPVGVGPLEFLKLNPFRRKRVLRRIWARMPLRPALRFVTWYFIRRGFMGGREGFMFCVLMSYYEFIIGAKMQELVSSRSPHPR